MTLTTFSFGISSASLALVMLITASSCATAADIPVLRDDFSQFKGWSAEGPNKGQLSLVNGRLVLAAPANGDEPAAGQEFRLEAAQNYRVNVNVVVTAHSSPDAWGGYWLFTPSRDVIWLKLSPQMGAVALLHEVNDETQAPLIPETPVPSLKTRLGESNQIVLDSLRGQLTLRINGVDVGVRVLSRC